MAPRKEAPSGEPTPKKHRNLKAPWEPGKSGNPAGRPKSSRNKLGEAFIEALHDDFTKHGKEAIAAARDESPLGYIKVCASILPKDLNININPLEELTDEQLIERIRQLDDAISRELGTGGPASRAEASAVNEQAAKVPAVH